MTYELGRAKFIVDFSGDEALAEMTKAFAETRREADKLAKELAELEKVRASDVRKAASVLIDEEKKLAREREKIAKEEAARRKKLIIDSIKAEVAALKEKEREEKAAADRRRRIAAEAERTRRREEAEVRRASIEARRDLDRREREERTRREREERDRRRRAGVFGIPGGPSGARVAGTIATLSGLGAIASGALLVREAIVGVTEATLKQEQAQLALNAAFGKTAIIYRDYAAQLAASNNKVTSEVQQAIATFGTLDKQTNLTSEQIDQLAKRAIDLQAAYGGDLREAFRSLAAAILGETEALEKYGAVLQDDVLKQSDKLTESERRRFTTMSESEKQLIRFRVAMQLTAEAQGKAAEKTEQVRGGFDKLKRGTDELSKSMGEGFVDTLGNLSGGLGAFLLDVAKTSDEFFKTDKLLKQAIDELRKEGQSFLPITSIVGAFLDATGIDTRVADRARAIAQRNAQIEAEKKADAERQRRLEDEIKRIKDERDRENAAIKERGERLLEQAQREANAERKRIDQAIKDAERRQKVELDALEERHKAELDALEEREYARRQASEAELNRIQAERDARLDALEEEKTKQLDAIEAEQEAVEAVVDQQIRDLTIARDKQLQAIEDNLEAELERLEKEQEAREDARREEDRAIEDSINKRKEKLEDAHKLRLRQLDIEKDKVQENSQDEIREIEKRERAEDERHRKAVRNLEDEAEQALDAIDEQIAAIERLGRQADDIRRRREGQRRVDEARQQLTLAQGTGTPEQVGQARTDLSLAIRLGDPSAIERAQQRLVEIAGLGIKAIAEAQQNLTDAEEDLRAENLDSERQAQIEQLRLNQDRIRKENEAEKRQEEDRNRRRKERLDRDKEAERDKLADAVKRIEDRRRKEDDAYEKDTRALEKNIENAKRKLQDRRREEDRNHERALERIRKETEENQEAVRATFDDEERGLIPAIKRAEKISRDAFESRRRDIERTTKEARDAIDNEYNHPVNGIIAQHKNGEEAARRAYENTAEAAKREYEKARKSVEEAYRHPDGKSGIIDQLEQNRIATEEKLEAAKNLWEDWKKGVVTNEDSIVKKTFKEIIAEYEKLLEDIKKRGGITITVRTPPNIRGTGGIQDNEVSAPGGGGSGIYNPPPGNVTPSGPQIPPSETVNEVDVSPSAWPIRLGWGQKYNSNHQAGLGWEADGNIAAWHNGPTRHKGVDMPAAVGTPVGSFTDGHVVSTQSGGPGGNMLVVAQGDKALWYMHLKSFVASAGDRVKRGQLIAYSGDSGSEGYPHLHFEVRTGYPPLNNGARNIGELTTGVNSIDPRPYMRGYDSGRMFMNPSLVTDLRTGLQSMIAEKRPEMLLGGGPTSARFDSSPMIGSSPRMNYMTTGANMAGMRTTNVMEEGDNFYYYGVAPEDIVTKWNRDQNSKSLLRGVKGLIRG